MKFLGLNISRSRKAPRLRRERPRLMNEPEAYADVMIRGNGDPEWMTSFSSVNPVRSAVNFSLFKLIRAICPFAEVAISKAKLLLGTWDVIADNSSRQEMLDEFTKKVRVNSFENGLLTWVYSLVDSSLQTGMGFGEAVLTAGINDIYKMKNCNPEIFRFVQNKDLDRYDIGIADGMNNVKVLQYPDYLYYLALDTRQGRPEGYSIFEGLPLTVQVYARGVNAMNVQMTRVSDPIYGFIFKPADLAGAKQAKEAISLTKAQWKKINQSKHLGQSGDLFTMAPVGGELKIEAIGPNNQAYRIEVPLGKIEKTLIARFGFPAFIYSAHDATTEALSGNQIVIMNAQLDNWRELINPLLYRIYDTFLTVTGNAGTKYEIEWRSLNLTDQTEEAAAEQARAAARKATVETMLLLLERQLIDIDQAGQMLIEAGLIEEQGFKTNKIGTIQDVFNELKLVNAYQAFKINFDEKFIDGL